MNRILGTDIYGSSPLTRGKRFTVTCCPPPPPAHPRSRGENLIVDRPANPQAGSSPLTRGKLMALSGHGQGVGLIPAHAGKTPGRLKVDICAPAHPRSRGENVVKATVPKS